MTHQGPAPFGDPAPCVRQRCVHTTLCRLPDGITPHGTVSCRAGLTARSGGPGPLTAARRGQVLGQGASAHAGATASARFPTAACGCARPRAPAASGRCERPWRRAGTKSGSPAPRLQGVGSAPAARARRAARGPDDTQPSPRPWGSREPRRRRRRRGPRALCWVAARRPKESATRDPPRSVRHPPPAPQPPVSSL